MKKTKLVLSVTVIISGVLTILFSPSIIKGIMYLNVPTHCRYSCTLWLKYLIPITTVLLTLGSTLIVVGIIYILFRKE